MIRTLHYLCLTVTAAVVLAILLPLLQSRADWLFVVGTVSLVGAMVTRMALDAENINP